MSISTRQEVYAALDSERAYQDEKWGGHLHEAESWVLFIEHYAMFARIKACTLDFADPENLRAYLDDIRKLTTLGVACMEQHGAPLR